MSNQLTANAIASFDAMVKHAYQGTGMLRPTVRIKTGVVGSTHRFHKMGKGTATTRVPQTDVVPMNVSHTNRTATLSDWNAPEYTDVFDQAEVNYSEQRELAETIASAIGRREDQLILDALDAASSSLTVSTDEGGTDTDMNTAKFRKAKNLLDTKQSGGERCFIMHANSLYAMLGDDDANTVDKNAVKMLVDGEMTKWLGFNVKTMEDRDEGGMPLSGSVRTSYAYKKDAVGLAIGKDFATEVNYIAHKTSWLANGLFKAGSVDIDAEGIVEISSTEP